jgi:hypothetical protein
MWKKIRFGNKIITNHFGVFFGHVCSVSQACNFIRVTVGSNLWQEIVYPDWGISWASSGSSGKYRNSIAMSHDSFIPDRFQIHH